MLNSSLRKHSLPTKGVTTNTAAYQKRLRKNAVAINVPKKKSSFHVGGIE